MKKWDDERQINFMKEFFSMVKVVMGLAEEYVEDPEVRAKLFN